MIDSELGSCRTLVLLATVLVLTTGLVVACSAQSVESPKRTVIAEFLTLQPDMVLTLTAWPTPPPLMTQAPTSTAAPQALWSIEEEPTRASPATKPPVQPTITLPSASSEGPAQARPAPLDANSVPVRLLVPALELDVPVVEVSWYPLFEEGTWHSIWQTADGAVGHHRNSANPGEAGNVVVSGHHNTRGEVFRHVSEIGLPDSPLGEGSEFILVSQDGSRHIYSVVQWDRFQVEGIPEAERRVHARYMAPSANPILTAITCWPYDGNSHRVVVVAEYQASE